MSKILLFIFLFFLPVCGICSQNAVKIGTHNSLTYLRPQWWLRWMNFTARCQNLTIQEQYKAGVRYFDFRIKFTRKGIRAGHGPMTYKADFDSLFNFLNGKGDCIVNIVLENRRWQGRKKDAEFVSYVDWLVSRYPCIHFVGGDRKRPWEKLIFLQGVPARACFEFYEGKNFKFPYPLKYARKKNKEYWKGVNDSVYSLFDFVEIR